MEITFIRHGQSEANQRGRWQGQGDSPLSELGAQQARSLGERLHHDNVHAVVSSDLTRAKQTARALRRQLSVLPEWREINVGAWEGLTREEVFERFPEETRLLGRGATDVPVGGGESWNDVRIRALAALQALQDQHQGKPVWVVTHGGLITTLTSSLLEISMDTPRALGKVINTSLTTFQVEAGPAQLVRFNDSMHLRSQQHGIEPRPRRVLLHVTDAHHAQPATQYLDQRTHSRRVRINYAHQELEPIANSVARQLDSPAPVPMEPSLPNIEASASDDDSLLVLLTAAQLQEMTASVLGCPESRIAKPQQGATADLCFEGPRVRLLSLMLG